MAGTRFRTYFEIAVGTHPVGRIVFEIRGDVCPRTAENWRSLNTGDKGVNRDKIPYHYKGTKLHRVIPDLMLQGGDITRGDGTGGESVWGDDFKDENFILRHTGPGCLSMGNRGPDTNSSIFFICSIKTAWLDEKHVVFGFVADGMEVVRAIERVGTPTGKPRVAVTITECGMYYGVKHAPSGKLVNVEAEDTWEMQRERALKAQAEAEAQAAEARKARLEARLAARGKRHSNGNGSGNGTNEAAAVGAGAASSLTQDESKT